MELREFAKGETQKATCDNKWGGRWWMKMIMLAPTAEAPKLKAGEAMTQQKP
jgi:hypothetical protein